jgi:hypothetical protein
MGGEQFETLQAGGHDLSIEKTPEVSAVLADLVRNLVFIDARLSGAVKEVRRRWAGRAKEDRGRSGSNFRGACDGGGLVCI